MMGITEKIRDYLEEYPGLSGGVMHVDWLPESARYYSLESVPCEPVLKEYMDGSSRRQFQFNLASSMFYSPDVENQVENMEWFESFDSWIQTQNLFRRLPDLGDVNQLKSSAAHTRLPWTRTASPGISCKWGSPIYRREQYENFRVYGEGNRGVLYRRICRP